MRTFFSPESSVRVNACSAFTEILHHGAFVKIFAVATAARSERTELLELLGVL